MYTNKNDLIRNYNQTKAIVSHPDTGVLITTIKAADGSSATLVRDDDDIKHAVNKTRNGLRRKRHTSVFEHNSPAVLPDYYASAASRYGAAHRKRAEMLRDPTMLADVQELVKDNDAILADYVN